MRPRTYLMALATLLLTGSLAAGSIDYDVLFIDFGTDPGKTDHIDDFSSIHANMEQPSFTANSLIWTRSSGGAVGVSLVPDTPFGLNHGALTGSTIDVAIRRIAEADQISPRAWDATVQVFGGDATQGERYRLFLFSDDTVGPALPVSSSEFNVYRFVLGAVDGQTNARIYANDDETRLVTGNIFQPTDDPTPRLRIEVGTSDLRAQGFEIDWVGISSEIRDNPPITEMVQPLPGDANRDGRVDGEDFLIWQASFSMQEGATWDDGDFNGDGRVDGEDFLIWQANFGTVANSSAITPEPAAALGILLGAMLFCPRRRRMQ